MVSQGMNNNARTPKELIKEKVKCAGLLPKACNRSKIFVSLAKISIGREEETFTSKGFCVDLSYLKACSIRLLLEA